MGSSVQAEFTVPPWLGTSCQARSLTEILGRKSDAAGHQTSESQHPVSVSSQLFCSVRSIASAGAEGVAATLAASMRRFAELVAAPYPEAG